MFRKPLRSAIVTINICALIISVSLASDQGADARRPLEKSEKPQPKFELRDGDRVVFLGNTLIERAQKYGYWETMLTARYPDRKIIFRNLGWDGDTVWAESRGIFDPPEKGYARMLERVAGIKPTVIFLGYGNNEAYAGKKGLPRFIKQYNKLLDDLTKVSAKGVRFVLFAPVRQLWLGSPLSNPMHYNKSIDAYSAAVNQIANARQAWYTDFNPNVELMQSSYDEARRGKLPELNVALVRSGWSHNGIHWKDLAYRAFANSFGVRNMNLKGMWAVVLTSDGKLRNATAVRAAVKKMTDGFRLEITGKEYPFKEFYILLKNAPKGSWELRFNGEPLQRSQVDDAGLFFGVKSGPHVDHYEKLRQAIIAKNRLYFHSWRPQNVTYLFLFRKHEQGQNAKEVKEFLRLVAEKEKEIDRLKKPVTRTYELIRVKPKKN